jgi:hypothetical protein
LNAQEHALVDIADFLASLRVPYMVVGAMAQAFWGLPRSTVDVDVTVWVEEAAIEKFVHELSGQFEILPAQPLEFIRDTRVLPAKTSAGVGIDIIFGMSPFEMEALDRAITRKVAGRNVRFCTAEDLILHKIVSEREQDLLDVRQLIGIRKAELDREYIDPRVREFADLLERPEIFRTYRQALE